MKIPQIHKELLTDQHWSPTSYETDRIQDIISKMAKNNLVGHLLSSVSILKSDLTQVQKLGRLQLLMERPRWMMPD